MTHAENVPDDCVVSLPRGSRSGTADSRNRPLHPAVGDEHRASARTLSVTMSRMLGRWAGTGSGGSGSGSRSEMPRLTQPRPVIASRRACITPWMKHVSGGAACSERDSTKSFQKQVMATRKPAMGSQGMALRAGRAARRAAAMMTTLATRPMPIMSRNEPPHDDSHAPSVPRSLMPRRTVSRPM